LPEPPGARFYILTVQLVVTGLVVAKEVSPSMMSVNQVFPQSESRSLPWHCRPPTIAVKGAFKEILATGRAFPGGQMGSSTWFDASAVPILD